jgi:hypothetical protein
VICVLPLSLSLSLPTHLTVSPIDGASDRRYFRLQVTLVGSLTRRLLTSFACVAGIQNGVLDQVQGGGVLSLQIGVAVVRIGDPVVAGVGARRLQVRLTLPSVRVASGRVSVATECRWRLSVCVPRRSALAWVGG